MNLAVLTSLYPSRALPTIGIFAERRWQGMSARGHSVHVIHPVPLAPWPFVYGKWREIHSIPEHEERGDIDVRAPRYIHVPKFPRANSSRFARTGMKHLLAAGRPDAVICDYAWPASAAATELQELGIPCVISGRGSDVLEVAGEAGLAAELAKNLKTARHWCAVSKHLLLKMDRLGDGAGTLVANGVDTDFFDLRDQVVARESLGIETRGTLIIVVGHLIPRKDPLLALEAFAQGAPADAELVFIGGGELLDELECQIAAKELAGRVRLAGSQTPEQLASWYNAADCLLLTSHREGRPNVVLEALSSGCKVVATDAGGTGELLSGLDSMLVPGSDEHDPVAIGQRLKSVLASNCDRAKLREAVAELSWERSLDALEACIENAIGDNADRT
ncbi:MAG: teichuronic acid biosynthesis glycosyltransferase TuaC [Planctomycetota bacterium]|jgi:teichuronic acid biosynthesis glycosyltransferase TuaC